MNEQFVIGVDGGGTKTAVVLLNQQQEVLGRGLSDSSNYHNVGLAQARANLLAGMAEAAAQAGLALSEVGAAAWALAGIDRPEEQVMFQQMAAEMLPGVAVQVENDSVGALMGGLGHHHGIVLIAGTGMIAYGENEQGQRARAGGWGPFFDSGSGYALAQSALRRLAQQDDAGEVGSAALAMALATAVALNKLSDFLGWIYAPERQVAHIAALAPVVLAAAEAGEPTALAVVDEGAAGLATAVALVAKQLQHNQPFELALAGGILDKNGFYRQKVAKAVGGQVPQAQPILPRADAAVGAALLALELLGR